MKDLVQLLITYRGRDKIIRLSSHLANFLAGDGKAGYGKKLQVVAKELSACRVILRLFDDLPMLAYNLTSGLGLQEKNLVLKALHLIGGTLDQLYFPLEHIAWLCDKQILPASSAIWWFLGILTWTASLITSVIRNIVSVFVIRERVTSLRKQLYLESSDGKTTSTEQNQVIKDKINKLNGDRRTCIITTAQNAADLVMAINWLPFPGRLWCGKLSTSKTALFGIISSAIGLYQLWPGAQPSKKL